MIEFDQASFDASKQLLTKARSLQFGRRLYRYSQNGDLYWLKMQLSNGHPDVIQGFHHELQLYKNSTLNKLLLPHVMTHYHDSEILVLPHAEPFLEEVDVLSCAQIQTKILQMLNYLQSFHQQGWIHGDLKPEHWVLYKAKLYLLDVEQAQRLNSPLKPLHATPRYMAPELFHGEDKTIKTDLYALGIVLLQWLNGTLLQANSYQDWAYLHCQHLNIALKAEHQAFLPLLQTLLARQKQHRIDDFDRLKLQLVLENAQ